MSLPGKVCCLAAVIIVVCCVPLSAQASGGESLLELCAERVRDAPDDLESYKCYWEAARRERTWDDSVRALEALLSIDPGNHRARLYLGAIEADLGRERAETLYGDAAAGFAESGERTGEVYARLSLVFLLRMRGRGNEAEPQLARALEVAEASGDVVLRARVQVHQAVRALDRLDYGRALSFLAETERDLFPDGPSDVQSFHLSTKGRACWALQLYEEGMNTYLREAELLNRSGDTWLEAGSRYNVALLAGRLSSENRMERGEHLRLVRQALKLAARVGHREVEARCRLLLGQYLEGAAALEEYRAAARVAGEIGQPALARQADRQLAQWTWRYEPERREEALERITTSIETARRFGDLRDVARGRIVRANMLWEAGDREGAVGAHFAAMDSVEAIRDLQPEGNVRARAFSSWEFLYRRFLGRLLELDELERAFVVAERMRARVLLDELDAAGVEAAAEDGGVAEQRDAVLLAIVDVQKRLSSAALDEEQRNSALEELTRLEAEESTLRDALARTNADFARLRAPLFATLGEIQETLAPDQALLTYSIPLFPERINAWADPGDAWVIVISRDDVFSVRIEEGPMLDERIAVFLGMLRRRDGSAARAEEELHDILLAEALERLSPSVRRLVIVPDGCLHSLPFDALRSRSDGARLAATYRTSYAPSATLWARWKELGSSEGDRSAVLSMADPALGTVAGESGERTGSPWLEGLRLGPLPHARREGRRLARSLGRGSLVLNGSEASESSLKESDLSGFGVLHFAAHAVVDHDRPDRSAVLLAPGSADEDGFLQVREIVDLDLDGKVVLLTACRSASGTLVEGEGVLGLARAFFQAGARAVVGSLWPLRDDETEALMREFSRNVARGRSLAGAMAQARKARIDANAPTAAWAGVVVLGDGDWIPLPGGRSSFLTARWWPWIAGGIMILVAAWLGHRVMSGGPPRP